jgi:RimJ/RimL family protein N-acetyltransferase
MSRRRFEYVLDLKNFDPLAVPEPLADLSWRHPSVEDTQLLAELMLASYQGTIDYDGETLANALKEVESFYADVSSQDWLAHSWLAFAEEELVTACLVGFWQAKNSPLIAYMMTAPHWKGKHLAAAALLRSLQELSAHRFSEVRAVITEGNEPSERLFTRAGFLRLSSD